MIIICYITVALATIKILVYFRNLYVAKRFLDKASTKSVLRLPERRFLILIPVLREQSVITKTLDHFMNLNADGLELFIVIAGTSREGHEKEERTSAVVEKWIADRSFPANIEVFYSEIDEIQGDRATQLNYAVDLYNERYPDRELDYIGVYDADSLPSINTLIEVTEVFETRPEVAACQQPVDFVDAANRMSHEGKNPLLVGNAIYQTTWTMIRELPSWVGFGMSDSGKEYLRNVYLIGHGEFLRYHEYLKFKFPEFEVTDGIQLGYRMGMSNHKIMALSEFCTDDVPQSIGSLVQQHKRWYGGCMKLIDAYRWTKNHFGVSSFFQLIDGYWSQLCWAFASPMIFLTLIAGMLMKNMVCVIDLAIILVYAYAIPYIALRVLGKKLVIRKRDWLIMPLAIILKSIGPNVYFFEKMFMKSVRYSKVER